MKKIFLSLLFVASLLSQAQETTTNDALRYALNNLTGTARFRGMSGAFGAVGGDANAIVPGKRMLSSMCPVIVTKNNKHIYEIL